LAAHLRELAAQEEALAQSYDRLATTYEKMSQARGSDPIVAREMKDHYMCLAEIERKVAAAADGIAGYRSCLAETQERVPVATAVNHASQSFAAFGK
jgi:hypothetical protein